jgi:hypothetical protein
MAMSDRLSAGATYLVWNAMEVHGDECDMRLETEYTGPVHPETGENLRCTCGHDQFWDELRAVHPRLVAAVVRIAAGIADDE